jgi:hypothetical protein
LGGDNIIIITKRKHRQHTKGLSPEVVGAEEALGPHLRRDHVVTVEVGLVLVQEGLVEDEAREVVAEEEAQIEAGAGVGEVLLLLLRPARLPWVTTPSPTPMRTPMRLSLLATTPLLLVAGEDADAGVEPLLLLLLLMPTLRPRGHADRLASS